MAKKYSTEAVVNFKMNTNQVSAGVRRIQSSFRGLSQWTQNLRAGLMGMNTRMMAGGAVMVGAGLAARSAVQSYERYSNAQARLRGILASTSSDMRLQTGLMEAADVAARQYGFGLGESSEAMGTLLETGVNAHEAMRYFRVSSQLARASNSDLESSSQFLVDSMRQFNDQSEEGAERLAATITVGARLSSTTIPQMQQAFRYAGVELSAMGYRSDEVAAALGALSSMGLRGTTAGTRLRGAMLALTRITGRSRDVMSEYGLEHERLDGVLYNTDGSLRTLVGASDQLTQIFSELPTRAAKLTLATALFGRRAYAAGVILSGLHPRAEDFRTVLGRLGNTEQNVGAMTAAAAENTRGFGAQMRFARAAAEDFGVTFLRMVVAPLETSDQGFGEYLRDLAIATQGAGMATVGNGVFGDSYRELSPAMQQTGRDFRRTLSGLADFIQVAGQAAAWIGRIAAAHPEWTLGLLMVGSIMRPFIGVLLPKFVLGLNALIIKMTTARVAGFTLGHTIGGMVGFWAAAAVGALALGDALGGVVAAQIGVGDEYERLGRQSDRYLEEAGFGWVNQVPVIDDAVRAVGRMIAAVGDLIDTNETLEAQRTSSAQRELRRRAGTTMEQVDRELVRQGGAREGESDMAAQSRMIRRLQSEDIFGLLEFTDATVAARSGIGAVGQAQARLREGGMSETDISNLTPRLQSAFDSLGGVVGYNRHQYERTGKSAESLSASLIGLGDAAQTTRTSLFGGTAHRTPAQAGATRNDVMVGSTGFLPFPVAAGDMLIQRNELANILASTTSGSLVGTSQPQVSATPSGGGGGSTEVTLNLDIPVIVDGREIARAVGRHTLQIDQRRGTTVRPGARRRVAETGVQ